MAGLVPAIHDFRFQAIDQKTWMPAIGERSDAVLQTGMRGHDEESKGKFMPAYWVARSKINDPAEYKKYTDRVPAIIAKYGGKVLARGGRFQIMEGPHKFQRFVVIEFPTFEQGVACFTSKEYDEAAAFRRTGAGEVETIIVDGGDATK